MPILINNTIGPIFQPIKSLLTLLTPSLHDDIIPISTNHISPIISQQVQRTLPNSIK